jgi:hypothetical protein
LPNLTLTPTKCGGQSAPRVDDFGLKSTTFCDACQIPLSGRSLYNKKPHSSPQRKVGFQNLLTITFLPGKVIGERISEGMIAE